MIPEISQKKLTKAMDLFDETLRESEEWIGWENRKNHKYAIDWDSKLYPVKKIVSMATDVPVSEFSGGEGVGQANKFVRDKGLVVVSLRGKNPTWHRDELILALDLYIRAKPSLPGKTSKEITELSQILKKLAPYLGLYGGEDYRNPNAVYMKLNNFKRFDPLYIQDGRVGLQRGGKLDKVIWDEYSDDPDRCHQVVKGRLKLSHFGS